MNTKHNLRARKDKNQTSLQPGSDLRLARKAVPRPTELRDNGGQGPFLGVFTRRGPSATEIR